MIEPDQPLVLLDTHVWIWMMAGDRRSLSDDAIDMLDATARSGTLLVSAISVWEVAMLEVKDRIRLSSPVDDWVTRALRAPGIELLPLDPAVAIASTRLPGDPHGDPADRILMASARARHARLATCDSQILAYAQTGHIRVIDARR